MAEVEFAYVGEGIKGNSSFAISYLEAVKDIVVEHNISEIAFSSNGFSGILLKSPILIFVKVEGEIPEAKFRARKILKELGFIEKRDLKSILKFAEEIDELPIEEVLKRIKE